MPAHETRLFHIGPQKGATTWIYECLKNHPDICTSGTDTIHFFDMQFHKGRSWYDAQFTYGSGTCFFDPTYTYLRCPDAAARIRDEFPQAKIMVNLRKPIDRAFAHYWHEKKKGAINVSFADALKNYDWFQTWVEPGLYHARLQPYIDAFDIENILPIMVDDIRDEPDAVLNSIYEFANLKPVEAPAQAFKIINGTGARQNLWHRSVYKIGNIITRGAASQSSRWQRWGGIERQDDAISPSLSAELLKIFMADIEAMESAFNLDLSAWKQ